MLLSLWSWFTSHTGIVALMVSMVVCLTGIIKIYTDSRGQRQNKRLADEKNKLELKAYRQQFCVPLLSSIHELAPVIAELRHAHDSLWARQKLFSKPKSLVKRLNRLFETANQRAAHAGSELSIDPDGQKVMDAFMACLKAKHDYMHAMTKPMAKFPTWFYNKADSSTLDALAQKANDKLTALEDAIRIFLEK